MTPKRGQPPKPPEKKRTEMVYYRYTPEEKARLEAAWEASGSPNTLSRWLAEVTLEEAERILSGKK